MAFNGRRRSAGRTRQAGGFWLAKTGDSPTNPQRCGVSGRPINVGDSCFFLVVMGSEPLPVAQVEISRREDNYSTGFRAVPSGEYVESTGQNGTVYRRPVFKYQQLREGGWHDVRCWSRAVLCEEAERRGFRVPGRHSIRHLKGDRTTGHEHRVEAQPETPLAVLAHVFDEEVDPAPVAVAPPA